MRKSVNNTRNPRSNQKSRSPNMQTPNTTNTKYTPSKTPKKNSSNVQRGRTPSANKYSISKTPKSRYEYLLKGISTEQNPKNSDFKSNKKNKTPEIQTFKDYDERAAEIMDLKDQLELKDKENKELKGTIKDMEKTCRNLQKSIKSNTATDPLYKKQTKENDRLKRRVDALETQILEMINSTKYNLCGVVHNTSSPKSIKHSRHNIEDQDQERDRSPSINSIGNTYLIFLITYIR